MAAVMKHEGVRFPCLLQRSCEAVKMKFALYLVLREHKADMNQRHSAGYELLLPRLLGYRWSSLGCLVVIPPLLNSHASCSAEYEAEIVIVLECQYQNKVQWCSLQWSPPA